MIPRTESTIRRSLSARASACEVVRGLLTGAKRLQDLREAERRELAECLLQAGEFMRAAEPFTAEIAAVMKGG